MNVLVTGGSGFVGSHLVEQLVAHGDHVRALVRRNSDYESLRRRGADCVVGDLDDHGSLDAACDSVDVVYHAAARVEIVGSHREFHRTTVAGTQRLLAASNAVGVRRFVYVSSCGIYHPDLLTAGRDIDENTPTPEPPAWFTYGRAKYRAEQVVQRDAKREWVIIRLGYLYGPRNRTMRTYLEPLMRENLMRIIGDGENEMAMVYVEDAVRAIVLAGRCPEAAGRVLIAGGDERITQRQYFDAIADGFGTPRVRRHIPYRIAFFLGWLGEFVAVGPRRAFMRRSAVALTGLPQRVRCDITRSLLGWRPEVRFKDGIRRAFEWYWSEYGGAAATPNSFDLDVTPARTATRAGS